VIVPIIMPRLWRLCLQWLKWLQCLANTYVSCVCVCAGVPRHSKTPHSTLAPRDTHLGTGTPTESRANVVFFNDFIGKSAIVKHMAPEILLFKRGQGAGMAGTRQVPGRTPVQPRHPANPLRDQPKTTNTISRVASQAACQCSSGNAISARLAMLVC